MASFDEKVKNLNNTADTTENFDPKDREDNKVMAILAYISWLVLIPLFAAKDSKFARYHCNQGLVLAITEICLGVIMGILSWIPVLGIIISILGGLVYLCAFILAVLGIINAANGKAKELPIIGKYRLLKDVDPQPAAETPAEEAPAEEAPAVEEPAEAPEEKPEENNQ